MKRLFSRLSALMTVVALMTVATASFAQDPNKVVVDKSLLTPEQLAKVQTTQVVEQVQQVSQFKGIGKEIGDGINYGLGSLTDQANKFANTKVGAVTMWLIAFKILGAQAIRLVVGIPLLVAFFCLFVYIWRKNCMVRSILVEHHPRTKETAEIKRFERYIPSGEIQAAYGIPFVIVMGILLAVTVGGGC